MVYVVRTAFIDYLLILVMIYVLRAVIAYMELLHGNKQYPLQYYSPIPPKAYDKRNYGNYRYIIK